MTHRPSEPCPFKKDENPIGITGSCCSFRGNMVALYLLATGLAPLVFRLYENKTPEEAIDFAALLRAAGRAHRKALAFGDEVIRRSGGVLKDPTLDDFDIAIPGVGWKFSAKQMFEMIETTARWHEKIGRMKYSIDASF
jgi:hypothetical protein